MHKQLIRFVNKCIMKILGGENCDFVDRFESGFY